MDPFSQQSHGIQPNPWERPQYSSSHCSHCSPVTRGWQVQVPDTGSQSPTVPLGLHWQAVIYIRVKRLTILWTINEPHFPYKTGLDVMQSHPPRRTRFGQYQASSAALRWPGDGDCYIMHRMQSGDWPYSKVGRDSSKALSLRMHSKFYIL